MIIEQSTPNVFVCSQVIEDWAVEYKTAELIRDKNTAVQVDITEYVYKQQVLDIVRRNVEHLLGTEAIQKHIQLCIHAKPWQIAPTVRPVSAVFVANIDKPYRIDIVDNEKRLQITVEKNSAVLIRNSEVVSFCIDTAGVAKSLYVDWIITAE